MKKIKKIRKGGSLPPPSVRYDIVRKFLLGTVRGERAGCDGSNDLRTMFKLHITGDSPDDFVFRVPRDPVLHLKPEHTYMYIFVTNRAAFVIPLVFRTCHIRLLR